MSEQPKDGGPAFPVQASDLPGSYEADPGMSLRDWFAGMALANTAYVDSESSSEATATYAYEVADAMLRARATES